MSELALVAPWLGLAERAALVFDERGDPDLANDEELRAVAQLERDVIATEIGNVVVTAAATDPPSASIEKAIRAVGRGAPPTPLVAKAPRAAARPGPWIPLRGHPWTEHGLVKWSLRCLRGAIALDESVTLLDRSSGCRIDLGSGETTPVPELGAETWEIVALPGALDWLSICRESPSKRPTERVRVRGTTEGPPTKLWGQLMGCSPEGSVVWGGFRCVVYWSVLAGNRLRPWTMGRVRWPDTHAKKLFGFLDNIGLWVDLAPDASASLSVMEYDTLLTPGLPVRWSRVGDACVAQGVTDHPLRALFFQYTGRYDVPEEECVKAEEEVRGRRATMSLGPDDERRYVVGFDANTWRVIGERSERIGLAGGGYAVYDSQHRVTSWGPERMWAGWDRWLLLETADGLLERLDLISGEREALVPIDRELEACVAVPGSPNFVLVAPEGESIAIRLV